MSACDLGELYPEMRARVDEFLTHCQACRFDVLIYCAKRSLEDQARLFRNGRSIGLIWAKADELSERFGRPDLSEILMNVGPQYGERIVTNAAPGQSTHNYGLAVDGVPMIGGKPLWTTDSHDDMQVWNQYGTMATGAGLEWAGHWTSFREYPHLQLPGYDWRDLITGREQWIR